MERQHTSQGSETKTLYHMIDVSSKTSNLRVAWAEGRIYMAAETLKRVRDKTLPKGDCFALAETAGILAAKKTSELIPLCHPLPLDKLRVSCAVDEESGSVHVICQAKTHSKTGVEMEALAGVQGALLTIYDITKQIDPVLSIGHVRLLRKEGGKSGVWEHPEAKGLSPEKAPKKSEEYAWKDIKVATVTISDRAHAGTYKDTSGELLRDMSQSWGASLGVHSIVPDAKDQIEAKIMHLLENQSDLLVLCTGGTGLSPRDVTPDVLETLAERQIPGIGEALRHKGSQSTPYAYLSRSLAVSKGFNLIIALPGSPKAVREGMQVLQKLVPHCMQVLSGKAIH